MARILFTLAVLVASAAFSRSVGAADGQPWHFAAIGAPVRAMTLEEALTYARDHHPAVKSALARLAATAADARVPRAQWMPAVGATLQGFAATANNTTASYVGARGIDIPRIGGTRVASTGVWEPSASTFAAVGATQEIYDFGRIAAQSAFVDLAYQAEGHRTDAERLRVNLLVKESYYGVLAARAVARAAGEARQRAEGHRDMAAAQVKSGLHPPIELTRAEADLARFQVGAIRAQGALRSAQAVFGAAVGIDESLLDAAGQARPVGPLPSLPEMMELAANRDPVLREARTRADAADALARAVGAETRPDLAFTATFSERAGTAAPSSGGNPSGPLPTVPNWDVGLVLRWQLLDAVVAARHDAAAARARVAQSDLSLLSRQEAAMLQETYVALEVALAALSGFQRAVEASHANYAQADARFKAGLGTSLELADAEGVRTDAEIQLAVGEFGAHRYRAVLGRLMGEEP